MAFAKFNIHFEILFCLEKYHHFRSTFLITFLFKKIKREKEQFKNSDAVQVQIDDTGDDGDDDVIFSDKACGRENLDSKKKTSSNIT